MASSFPVPHYVPTNFADCILQLLHWRSWTPSSSRGQTWPAALNVCTSTHCINRRHFVAYVHKSGKRNVTGSDRIRGFRCRKFSLAWWVLRPMGAHSGHARDFKYGSSVHLPTSGCLLLWRYLSHRALLTACDTPPDGLSWPKHFGKPSTHSTGQGGLCDSCNYTPCGVNHPQENTEPQPRCCSWVTPTMLTGLTVSARRHHVVFAWFSKANIL